MSHYLYRNSARRAISFGIAVFLTVATARAQSPRQSTPPPPAASGTSAKKAKRGPRAIAVVEFLPGGGMRLVPIALWIDGHYYDASLYGANPAPMAVEPQTVYEAQSFGEPTGTFTITQPRQLNGAWIADGTWQPHLAMDEDLAKKAAKDAAGKPTPVPNKTVFTGDTDDSRPVLKRAPGSGGDSSGSSQPAQSTAPSDPDRPTMKRPASDSSSKPTMGSPDDASSASPSSAKAPPQTNESDPDRPVMKRPASSSSGSDATSSGAGAMPMTQAAATANDNDPSRPVLSRNKIPQKQTVSDLPSPKNDVPFTANAKGAKAYPAISDAGSYQGRPLLYSMSAGERQTHEQQVLKLAMDEIRAFAAKRNGPMIATTASITEYDVRAFDLDYSSSPTIVLTAKLPVAAPVQSAAKAPPAPKPSPAEDRVYFVTLVVRLDINDQPVKIFSLVTDSKHLDAYPRMELIDAVDADANGRGDLLFRQYSDVGVTYGLYRVSPYQLDKIFEGGSGL
jgi:hypothetical protein